MSAQSPALPRLLAGPRQWRAATLGEHLSLHGLPALDGDADALATAVEQAGLRGRGGAGFPTARKLHALRSRRGRFLPTAPIVVANGSEAEPASEKDRVLLGRSPHLVLDGLQLTARAVGAARAVLCLRADAATARAALAAALDERAAAGRDRIAVTVVPVAPGFVAGEERSLVHALNGGPPIPTAARPWERGVEGRPTLVQNVESLAHVALIARRGPAWFRALGSDDEPGSALATVIGAVARPGVHEVPLGVSLDTLLAASGGDLGDAGALLVGGYAGGWLTAEQAHRARLLRADLAPLGASVGCGLVAALPRDGCGVAETARLVRWLAGQSAGQCGPCVHGLDAIAGALESLCASWPPAADPLPDLRRWCGDVAGRGACGHPDGVVRLVRSALTAFASELDDHARHGACARCDAPPALPLPRARPAGQRTSTVPETWRAAA